MKAEMIGGRNIAQRFASWLLAVVIDVEARTEPTHRYCTVVVI